MESLKANCAKQSSRSSAVASRVKFENMSSRFKLLFTCSLLVMLLLFTSSYHENRYQVAASLIKSQATSEAHNGMFEASVELHGETSAQSGWTLNDTPTRRILSRRSPVPAAASAAIMLMQPLNEMRASGSKSEPPSRPTVDWSRQRPYFGPDMQRNVSVELGKTAYLTCKVYELGDKTVSWLRPRENEILTSGKYNFIGDPRFSSINDNGSNYWILEIKDVGLNDSTSYECQVSTDPKMSTIINLEVKAAKARIKQGEQFYAPVNSNIEFTCEISFKHLNPSLTSQLASPGLGSQQTYWYHNGNLLNYARTSHLKLEKNFSIEWDPMIQMSRFKLFNVQPSDAGNYTCKSTNAEPTSIRLHVKKPNRSGHRDRSQYNGYQHDTGKEQTQRNRQQHYGLLDTPSGLELNESNSGKPRIQLCLYSILLGSSLSMVILQLEYVKWNR